MQVIKTLVGSCGMPQLNTLGHPVCALDTDKCIAKGERIAPVFVLFKLLLHCHTLSSEDLSPFLGGGSGYASSSSWLKIVPTELCSALHQVNVVCVLLLVSVSLTAQAFVLLLVLVCCDIAQAALCRE